MARHNDVLTLLARRWRLARDWRDIAAWAGGLSRAVDYLVTDPAIDPDKIVKTGVSRYSQARSTNALG